jgi:rod shape determining protein RodA
MRALGDRFNWVAVAAIVMLLGISLVMQRNADFYSGDNFYDRQVIWVLVGVIFSFVPAVFVDLRLVERAGYWVLALSVVLLLATVFFGTEVNHSKRWLRLGSVNIQASELAKIGVILALARLYHARRERVPGEELPAEGPYSLTKLLAPALVMLVPAGLIIIQPDLGTSLAVLLVGVTMTLYEGVSARSVLALAVIGMVVVPVAWKYGGIQDYQKRRVTTWLNPELYKYDPETTAEIAGHTQSEQAVWAISSGEFWGQGSQQGSQQRLKYLPEMHSDMILAPFAEEQGFAGCTVLLVLFWVVVIWALRTAKDARDRFCELVAVGVAAMIGLQVFVNIGMVAGLLPIVGLPLPFLSYGGSAMITLLGALGLVLNVAFRRGRM